MPLLKYAHILPSCAMQAIILALFFPGELLLQLDTQDVLESSFSQLLLGFPSGSTWQNKHTIGVQSSLLYFGSTFWKQSQNHICKNT